MTSSSIRSSFRDPSALVFRRDGVIFRQINGSYAEHYNLLMQSGLYGLLVESGLLVSHQEVSEPAADAVGIKVIRPEPIPFISYPYEWSFGMLKDAALATLRIQREALGRGLVLKDASAYNIQFLRGRPVLMDTLSFETYSEGQPWAAYRQFCQHFLAPLALMAYTDVRLGQLLRLYIDGVPLDLAARLLPSRARFNLGLSVHIFVHASLQRSRADRPVPQSQALNRPVSKQALLAMVENLEGTVRRLDWKAGGTEWADYYAHTNYAAPAFQQKRDLVAEWVAIARPSAVWDLGANDGTFSRLASDWGASTVAFDIDPAAVERNYGAVKASGESNLLPLVLDLTNPSPAIGWSNRERDSLLQRGPADLVLALALIHHLAISNNVPLPEVARFFAEAGRWLIVEFVPKSDSQVQRLLSSRKDIFDHYTVDGFESAFAECFQMRRHAQLVDSERRLYLMERR